VSTPPAVRFSARGAGYELFVNPTEAALALRPSTKDGDETGASLLLSLLGANPASVVAAASSWPAASTTSKVATGQTGSRVPPPTPRCTWKGPTRASTSSTTATRASWSTTFVVAPGADPEQIRLGVTGAAHLRLDKDGSLVLATPSGTVSQHPPVVYQQVDGVRRAVEGSYVLLGPTRWASASAPMTATGEGPGLHARYHRAGGRHGHQGRPNQDDIVGVRRRGHGGQQKALQLTSHRRRVHTRGGSVGWRGQSS